MSVKFQIFFVILSLYCTDGTGYWTKDKTLSTKVVAGQLPGTIKIGVRKKPSTNFNWHYFPSTKLAKLEHFFPEPLFTTRKKKTPPYTTNTKKIQTQLHKITRTNIMTSKDDKIVLKSTNSITSTLDLDASVKDSDTNEMSTVSKTIATGSEEDINISSEEKKDAPGKKKVTNNNKITSTRKNKITSRENDIALKTTEPMTSTLDLDVSKQDSDTNVMSTIPNTISTSSEEDMSASSNKYTATEKEKVTNNNKITSTRKNKMTTQEDNIVLKTTKSVTSTLDLDVSKQDSDTNEISTITNTIATSSEEDISTSSIKYTATEKEKVTNNNKITSTRKNKITSEEHDIVLKTTKSITSTLDLDVSEQDRDTNEMSTITNTIATGSEEDISVPSNEKTAAPGKKKVTKNNKITSTRKNKITSKEDDIVLKTKKSITSTLDLDVSEQDSGTNEMSTNTNTIAHSSEEDINTSNNKNTVTEKENVTNNNKITTEAKKNESKTAKYGKSDITQNGRGNKKTRREKKETILNPYDLKNDLLEVMSYFPNTNVSAEVIGRSVEYKDIVLLKITDAISHKKVGRADVNEVKKDRGEGIGMDVETTDMSKKIDTEMQDKDKGFAGNEGIKKEDRNKSEEISAEIDATGKKIIFIVHGLSTFELWKIPCLYETIQLKILTSFYLSHLKNFDIFLIPVANPDGFARKDNHWNKNLSPQEDCGGVALDRNFDIAWASKSNVSSCDQLYPGSKPFSEAETEAIKDVFLQYGKRMAAYIHVHATDNNFDYRGNTVLIPKGHTDEASDEDKYLDLKGEIDEAMRKVFNTASVNMKTLYSWYGPVAGTSVDYAAEVIGVPIAMEFLMQPYQGSAKGSLNLASLTHIWKRVIDTVFTFIHNINNSDESD